MANPERRMERGRTPVGQGSSKDLRAAGFSRLLLPMMGQRRRWSRGNTRWRRVRGRRRSRRGIQARVAWVELGGVAVAEVAEEIDLPLAVGKELGIEFVGVEAGHGAAV